MRLSISKIIRYLTRENRILVVTLSVLVAFSFMTYAFAVFNPGDTNDPSCAPGDSGCYVQVGTGTLTSLVADATLTGGTITTTGTIGIDLSHANTWTGQQTFGTNILQTQGTPTVKGEVINSALAGGIGVDVSGKYAYVAASANFSLDVVDISNPSAPTLVGFVQDATQLSGAFYVKVVGKYAYVTSANVGRFTVVDISNPVAPTIVASLLDATNLGQARGLYISGKYAYVTAFVTNRLTVIDISNPSAPVEVSTLQDNTNLNGADGVYVTGKYAYIAAKNNNGLSIFNISDPTLATFVGAVSDISLLGGLHEVYVSGKYAYVVGQGNTFGIIDISNPAAPSIVSTIQDSTNFSLAKGLDVAGKYAYVTAAFTDRLTVVDISNPSSPTIIGTLHDATNLATARDIRVVGKYAYVAMLTGLTVIDLNGIDTPSATISSLASQRINVSENAEIGNSLYVRNGLNVGSGGLKSGGPISIQSSTIGSAAAAFDVQNSAGTSLLFVRDDGKIGMNTALPGQMFEVDGNPGDTTVVRVATSGGNSCDFSTLTGTFSCASDVHLKNTINPLGNSLDKITALNPVTYHYNWQKEGDPLVAGFIAQDYQNVFPDLVSTRDDGNLQINQGALIPYLVEAIKELDLKVESSAPIDTTSNGSLADRLVQFLQTTAVTIREATIGTLHIDGQVCVDDVCVTRDQFKQMLINGGGTEPQPVVTPPPADPAPVPTPDPTQ